MGAKFDSFTTTAAKNSLASKLMPVADSLRNLRSKFGLRPYTVSLVRVRWSGGYRGNGVDEVVSTLQILPTPTVSGVSTMGTVVEATGTAEEGTVYVSDISGRFTEDQLSPALAQDEDMFWEVVLVQGNAPRPIRRRFTANATPSFDAEQLAWSVSLSRVQFDRSRDGDLE
jgi:hypothetical protein